jgi:exopolysaccharide biosynthesis protein
VLDEGVIVNVVKRAALFFKKPYRWAAVYSVVLTSITAFILLDAFVIPRPLSALAPPEETPAESAAGKPAVPLAAARPSTPAETKSAAPVITDSFYSDENISITIETVRKHETTIFIADITISTVEYFRTAFAKNTYGRNISETTSSMAAAHNALFAINGDYYGFREQGCVLRNGIFYRNTGTNNALIMDISGTFYCKDEGSISREDSEGAWQMWSFGPALVLNGNIVVSSGSEVTGRSAPSNPRTAIGQAGPLRYIAIVSNGRTASDRGLTLLQVAALFRERGCSAAYNLDGGGSSCMVFNGRVLNNPTTNGNRIVEREISDIIYIGYE